MSSNFKRESGTLDSFFMPREKKPKNATNTAICATSSHELVMPNEDNFVSDSQIDNQIQDVWDTSKIWPALWTKEQVIEFQKKNSWLSSKNGKLGCNNCIQAKNSINFQKSNIDSKVRISSEWVGFEIIAAGCNRTNQLASLRNKIKQHSESKAHVLAENILKKSSDKVLDKMFERISEVEIDSNTRLFRTVYCLAKNHRPFKQFEELVQLQQINGLDMGSSLHSRITATRMVNVIAKEMRKRLILRLIQSNSKFTIMIDESTTLSTKCTLILYISSYFDVESPVVAFLDLIDLDRQDAETIEKSIWLSLECNGISTSFALNNWIAFASDGASVMTGKKAGVATKLREKIPNLFTWHCLCHRLELSVHDVIKDCTGVSRFQSLMDKLYAYYHQSPKNSMGLDKSCVEVGIEMKKIGRVLNVRWSASSFRTIKAIWNNYPGIYLHVSKTHDVTSNGIKKN
ncbi:E3 SUMO-protein ligase KIAA1586-like [Rhopalosiphum maidis]|uniref:E3 SUMO-protein ligase KIAA1586-like n=1 Tax=Rhopalosiphum maidis TaxID=43146 RepID=UPI000EFF0C5B|nr:E3 SUMO-protein ligase KIAA1586-like [Rhopalosiphum maidis]